MCSGSRPTSSANMQKTSRLTKCATACGAWPRSRNACATVAKDAAARSVSDWRVSPGRSRSGFENAHLSLLRAAAPARSSRSNSCVSLTLLVQLVRTRNRSMSETMSSGGFSGASAYCRSCSNAASRSARCPLYSQAKWWRFQTSAQPSPPVSLRAPPLEAVRLAGRIGLGRRRLVQQPAEVDEVLLRRGALLQRGGAPLGDEVRTGSRDVLSVHVAPVAEPYDQDPQRVFANVANHAIVPDPIAP